MFLYLFFCWFYILVGHWVLACGLSIYYLVTVEIYSPLSILVDIKMISKYKYVNEDYLSNINSQLKQYKHLFL